MARRRRTRHRNYPWVASTIAAAVLALIGYQLSQYWGALVGGVASGLLVELFKPGGGERTGRRLSLAALALAFVVAVPVAVVALVGSPDEAATPSTTTTTTESPTTTGPAAAAAPTAEVEASIDPSVTVATGPVSATAAPSTKVATSITPAASGPAMANTAAAAPAPISGAPTITCVTAYHASKPLDAVKNHIGKGAYHEEAVQLGGYRSIRSVTVQVYRLTDQGHSHDASLPPADVAQEVRVELRGGNALLGSKNFVTSTSRAVEWILPEPIDATAFSFITLRVVNISQWWVHVAWVDNNPYVFGELVSSTSGAHPNVDLGAKVDVCNR